MASLERLTESSYSTGVRGIIIAKEITEDLVLATSKIKDIAYRDQG